MSGNPSGRRVPPQDLAAEQAVLGACLLRPGDAQDILEGLRPELLYSPPHRLVMEAMLSLIGDGSPLDLVTLTSRMTEQGTLGKAGGAVYLAELADSPVSPAHAKHHAEIVLAMARRRAMIDLGQGMLETAYDPTADSGEYAARAQEIIDQVLEDRVNVPAQRPSAVAHEAYAYAERMQQGHGDLLKSSIYELNSLIGGYGPGEVTVLAARPGMGKTALALCEAGYFMKKEAAGGIFSLEMRASQLALRMFAQRGGVNAQRFRDGEFTDEDMRSILDATAWLSGLDGRLRLWDRPGLTPQELRAQVRKWKREIGIRWIIVDYLQLMRPDIRSGSREQDVAEVSRALKNIALEYEVAVLCLAQLNREADKTKRPLLSQLRESGAVEQDADIIMFIGNWDTKAVGDVVSIEIDVAKGRSNKTGTAKAYYQRPFLRFVNQDYQRRGERF